MAGATDKERVPLKRRISSATVNTPVGPLDLWLSGIILALLVLGVVMVYSASIGPADIRPRTASHHFLYRHLFSLVLGFGALLVGLLVPYRAWDHLKLLYPLLIGSALLMVVCLFFEERNQAKRWIYFGSVSFQPYELAKLVFVIYLARSLSKRLHAMKDFWLGFLPHVVVFMAFSVVLFLQRDLSGAILLAVLMSMMLFIAGTQFKFVSRMAAFCGLWALAIAYSGGRWARILSYLNPWFARDGDSMQISKAITILGSGGLFGFGLGQGPQNIGDFLPESYNDFIFSVIGEELGFIGVVVTLLLFILLIVRGLWITLRLMDPFAQLLALGLTLMIGTQAAINIGVAVNVVPTTGVTLPFVSFGGSSMLTMMLAAGLLLQLSRFASAPTPEESAQAAAEESKPAEEGA